MNVFEAYEKCIKRKYDATYDRYSVDCSLGLWGVEAPTEAAAEIQAAHYFAQYYADGEYKEFLSGLETAP